MQSRMARKSDPMRGILLLIAVVLFIFGTHRFLVFKLLGVGLFPNTAIFD
jgi:hypothetical protein